MGVYQTRANSNSFPVILDGVGFIKDQETVAQDGSRTVPLAQFTLMSKIASSGKWVPWINANLGDTTGKQYPDGILMSNGGITAAQLVAGDVTLQQILYMGSGCFLDSSQIVFDGGSTGVGTLNTLASVITTPTNLALTAEDFLAFKGFSFATTVQIQQIEN